MKWWLARKSFKFFFKMPGWLRFLTVVLVGLILILVPVLGLVIGVLVLVVGLVGLLLSPLAKVGDLVHRPWK